MPTNSVKVTTVLIGLPPFRAASSSAVSSGDHAEVAHVHLEKTIICTIA